MKGADLHCHSLYSDGTYSPQQLVDLAKEQGFIGVSITDHDSLCAFHDLHETSFMVIPGIELSTEHKGESVHVLGYAYDPESESLEEFCQTHRERRERRNEQILVNLRKKGMHLSMEEVKKISPGVCTYGRPHLARALVQKGYIPDIATAFKKYIGAGKSCYVAGEMWTVLQAIEAIHAAKGKAVLAHPHLIKKEVNELLEMSFDGIEAYYSMMSKEQNERWCEIGKKHNLFITGGSDFHGETKPKVPFGASWAPVETVEMLYHHYCENVR